MLERAGGRAGWFLEVSLLWVWATTGGCAGGDDPAPVAVARNRLVGRPAEVRRTMRPLAHAPDSHPAPDTGLAFTEGLAVDARVLVITADGTDAAVERHHADAAVSRDAVRRPERHDRTGAEPR